MRVVVWNCCRGPLSKKLSVLERLEADVAVVAECPQLDGTTEWSYAWCGANPRQGLAVLVREPFSVAALPSVSGAAPFVLPVRVSGPVPFNLLAVWTQKEANYVQGLRSVLEAYEGLLAERPAILAGDLNSNAIWDREHRSYSHSDFVADMESRGFVSSYHTFLGEQQGSETRATHHWRWSADSPFHIDYCFIPRSWVAQLAGVAVLPLDPSERISDHLPLVVDLSADRLGSSNGGAGSTT
jgi:exodeoxyribonuclease III